MENVKGIYELVEYDAGIPARVSYHDSEKNQFYLPYHWHRSLEIMIVLKGVAIVNINGIDFSFKEGELIYINSGDIHMVTPYENKELSTLSILISYDFLKDQNQDMDTTFFDIDSISSSKIIPMCIEIGELFANKEAFYLTRLNALLLNICYILMRHCCKEKSNGIESSSNYDSDYVKEAIGYVSMHYKEKITVKEVADYVGLQENYFCRHFKQKTGGTFYNFINRVRLYYALLYYINHDVTVLDTAFSHGFHNVKSFINICKSMYDCTPSQYKKRIALNDSHC